MNTKKNIEVTLLNQRFTIKSDLDDKSVTDVAKYVDGIIGQIQASSKSVSSLNIALLACMNVAGEYMRLRDERKSKGDKASKKIKELIELVNKQL